MNSVHGKTAEVNGQLPPNLAAWGHDVMSFVRLQGNNGGKCQMCGMTLAHPLFVAVGRSGRIAGPVCMICADSQHQRIAPVGDALPEVLR